MKVSERIAKLRELMKSRGVDFYIVPTADFHQSEYVGEHFKARAFITGFTGSAGTAVIALDEAKLWTDGRYFLQAGKQLEGSGVDLMKMGQPGVPTISEYLTKEVKSGKTIGVDGRVITMAEGMDYAQIAKDAGAKLVYDLDLIDEVWTDRPPMSKEPAFALELKYAGESTTDKLKRIREFMSEHGADKHVLTTLDDICWTLNIRGNDIEFFPLLLSYAIIDKDSVLLYIDESKLSEDIKKTLAKDNVVLKPYNDIYEDIKKISVEKGLLLDSGKLNYALYCNIPDSVIKVDKQNPEIIFKAIKNKVEIENIKKAQIKDSVAHIKFMKWLKENVSKEKITEMSASDKLDEFRAKMGNFIRPSFEPICAFGEHGAIVHYTSKPETNSELKEGSLFLTDTGAGFYEGSTDITRTYALGEVPDIVKEHFTLVLIANLRLGHAKFKKGCNSTNLDMYTRMPFWDRGLDYNHGTGHGVGYLLNIHEGPAGIRWQYRPSDSHPFEPGMIITNEPGLYIAGSHGIRLENEILVREAENNEYGQFLDFETITYVPMDLDAVKKEIMNEVEIKLLNEYHAQVYEKTKDYLNDEEKEWLKKYTRSI